MHDDRATIRGRNARKRALHRSGVSISLSRLSDRIRNFLTKAKCRYSGPKFGQFFEFEKFDVRFVNNYFSRWCSTVEFISSARQLKQIGLLPSCDLKCSYDLTLPSKTEGRK